MKPNLSDRLWLVEKFFGEGAAVQNADPTPHLAIARAGLMNLRMIFFPNFSPL